MKQKEPTAQLQAFTSGARVELVEFLSVVGGEWGRTAEDQPQPSDSESACNAS
jgi:hypothetical protein